MIIIDAPYASAPLLDYMEESQHPVLANDFSRSLADARSLNLVDDAEAARRLEAWTIPGSPRPSSCSRTRRSCARSWPR